MDRVPGTLPQLRFRVLGHVDLRGPNGAELRAVLVQPKRLALLAYLALAKPRDFHRRDSLLALFWPESSEESARNSLRQSLHFLREHIGPGLIVGRGDDEIGVDHGAVWCDVSELEVALAERRFDEALALYRGHLLEGFHASGVAAEFEQWLDMERERLRLLVVRAAVELAEEAEQAKNLALAARRARDVLRLDPNSESAARRLMSLLDRTGDRSEALRVYDELTRRLSEDLEVRPSPESAALAEQLRSRGETDRTVALVSSADVTASGSSSTVRVEQDVTADGPLITAPPRRQPRILAVIVAVAAVAVILTIRFAPTSHRPTTDGIVLAVGAVEDRTGEDSLAATRVLRDLLATDLSRLRGVSVVSQARIQQVLAREGTRDEAKTSLTEAARQSGAAEVLEGVLYRHPSAGLRLDLRRVDIESGVIRRSYAAEAPDLFTLVARVSERLAAEFGQAAPSPPLADITTTSLVARRFYEEGVRAFYQSDAPTALRFLRAALAEDSTFAMAAYFAARAASDAVNARAALSHMAQAARQSHRATERERLIIAAAWATWTNSPTVLAAAESLAVRYPLDPEAVMTLGTALSWAGDYLGAAARMKRALELDSLSILRAAPESGWNARHCTACDAASALIQMYFAVDSLDAAERAARDWVRRQPRSYAAQMSVAAVLDRQGRAAEAMATQHAARPLAPPGSDDTEPRVVLALRAGDFAAADQLLDAREKAETSADRSEVLWWRILSLRTQGRLQEALVVARRLSESDTSRGTTLATAQVMLESGRPREAARIFAAIARAVGTSETTSNSVDLRGLAARSSAWYSTHLAVALAASGDTARVARLADSVEAWGRLSAFGRDRTLHHHLRGLLLRARGRSADAVDEFRRAISSPTAGYTRTNLELGRELIALGKPREAIAALRPALRGDLQAGNYYVTHAELHEILAQAFEQSGNADSARAHYAWVANAWRRGDAQFAARAQRATQKAAADSR